jgi:hypothetical protein
MEIDTNCMTMEELRQKKNKKGQGPNVQLGLGSALW